MKSPTGAWTEVAGAGRADATVLSCGVARCAVGNSAGGLTPLTRGPQPTSAEAIDLGDGSITAVACPVSQLCLAGDGNGRISTVSLNDAGAKQTVGHFEDPDTSYACRHYGADAVGDECSVAIEAISCPSKGLCAATDNAGAIFETTDPTDSAKWSIYEPENDLAAEALTSLTCPSSHFCAATDATGGDVIRWDPSGPASDITSSQVGNQALTSIACSAAEECFVADDAGGLYRSDESASVPVWTGIRAPQRIAPRGVYQESLSCATSGDCYAVDSRGQLTQLGTDGASLISRGTIDGAPLSIAPQRPASTQLTAIQQDVARAKADAPELSSRLDALLPPGSSPPAPVSRAAVARPQKPAVVSRLARPMAPLASQATTAGYYGTADGKSICATPSNWTTDPKTGIKTCSNWIHGFASYYKNSPSAYTTLRNSTTTHLTQARFFIPYDAVAYYDTKAHQCAPSPAMAATVDGRIPGQEWWTLYNEIKDAQSLGLTPIVVPSAGVNPAMPAEGTQTNTSNGTLDEGKQNHIPGAGFIPPYPDENYGYDPSSGSLASNTDTSDWVCGIDGIDTMMHKFNVVVSHWEALNEADTNCVSQTVGQGGCDPVDKGGQCSGLTGPGNAASLYFSESLYLADIDNLQLAAGVLSHPNPSYFNDYYCYASGLSGPPDHWSYHDYYDLGSYAHNKSLPAASQFNTYIYDQYLSNGDDQPTIWITEAAINLANPTKTYSDGTSTTSCNNGQVLGAGTLGCESNGSPTTQASDAQGFSKFLSATSHVAGQVNLVLWYEFQPNNGSTGFDSGLLAPGTPLGTSSGFVQRSPDDVYGSIPNSTGLRQSFCVLAGLPASSCSSNATEAWDWSLQPRQFVGTITAQSATATRVSIVPVTGSASFVPTAGAWVTCYDEAAESNCAALPQNERLKSVSANPDGTFNWTLSIPAPMNVTGRYQLSVSSSVIPDGS